MSLVNNHSLFNEYVGEFILSFSTVEYQIGELASIISNGIDSENLDPNVMGLDLHQKLKLVRVKLKENSTLNNKWGKLEGKLSQCNDFRRFLSHGIVSNHVPNPHLTGLIRAKHQGVIGFRFKKITKEELFKQIQAIQTVHTGKNGLGVLVPEIKSWLKK